MKLGDFEVPQKAASQILRLLERAQAHPFRGHAAARTDTDVVETRLVQMLEILAHEGLDWEAALLAFAAVDYLTDQDCRRLWRNTGEQLKLWLENHNLNFKADVYFLQIENENHITTLFEACGWPDKSEPRQVPRPSDVEGLWWRIDSVRTGTEVNVQGLCLVDERPVWVLLWDLNLSGKTISTEIGRLHRCMQMMPTARSRHLVIAGILLTDDAHTEIKQAASNHGINVDWIYPRILTDADRLQNHASLSDTERQRIITLCEAIHEKWIRPEQREAEKAGKKGLFRSIGPLGYRDGGWMLVKEDNCPNNTLPLLWLHTDYHTDYHGEPYAGPFPRRFSRTQHESTAEPRLNKLTQAELNEISLTLSYYLGVPESQRRIQERPYKVWQQEVKLVKDLADEEDDPEGLSTAHAKVLRLLEELPADKPEMRYDALVARAQIALTNSLWEEFHVAWSEIDGLDRAGGFRPDPLTETRRAKIAKRYTSLLASPRLPTKRYCPTGPPKELELQVLGPEPLTTRRPAAATWRDNLVRQAKTGHGSLYVVVGTSGWGKSTFTRLSVQGITSPMLYVDLTDVETEQNVGYALLAGAKLDEEDKRLIDRHALAATNILDRLVRCRCVIVFENIHRTSSGHPAPGLDRFLWSLVQLGHIVVLESWSRGLITLPQEIESGEVHIMDGRSTLVPLDREEILAWARAVLARSPDNELIEYLDLFDSHPRKIRAALELLRDKASSHPDVIAKELLDLVDMDRDDIYEQFLQAEFQSSFNSMFPDDLACWLCVFPWVAIPEEWLSEQSNSQFYALSAAGLVSRNSTEGTWSGHAWARTLALRQLANKPELLPCYEDLLNRLALRVPGWRLRVQRRHIAALMSRLQHEGARTVLVRLLEGMPRPEAIIVEYGDSFRLEAPATVKSGTVRLPPDVAAWAMEGAARRGDVNAVAGLMRYLTAAPDESASYFADDWQLLKSVHGALAVIPGPGERKTKLYEELVPVIVRTLDSAGVAERAWCVRLLAFAAGTARADRRFDLSEEWLKLAISVQEGIPIPNPGTSTRYAYDDNTYYIRLVRCRASPRLEELVQAHVHALESIPPTDAQSPESRERWACRTLYHLKHALRAAGTSSKLVSRLRTTLADLPASSHWFYYFHRYQMDVDDLPKEVGPILTEALAKKVGELRGDPQADQRLLDLVRLFRPGALVTPDIVALMRRVAAKVEHGLDIVDMDIFRHCLRILERRQNEELRGWRRDAADACETVLNYLRIHATLLTNDDIAVELRRHCLKYMEYHYLYPLHLAHVAEEDGRSEGERARRRIDAMYRMHASATEDPWLWDDWAAAAIHVVRAGAFAQPDQEVTQKRYLIDVQAEVDRAIALHPAADAVAVRTLLYLWHFEECLDRAMRMLEQPLSGRVRLRVVRLGLDLLAPLALEPPILRCWTPPEPYRTRLVSIYKQLLQEHAAMVGRSQARHWAQAAITVLDGKLNTEGWSDLIEPLRQRMGSLEFEEECWRTIIAQPERVGSALGEPEHGLLKLLDDLTDATSIFLVGILLRFGASDESLPRPLRQKLAELAIISGSYAESWERSMRRGSLSVDVTLHKGYAIAMALTLSGDGTVRGKVNSGLMSRQGRNLTWHEVMNNYFSATLSNAVGRFRSFVKEVHRTLRMKINVPR